jgi:methylmalonyl-CoA/ethylmalonyl-CoA epimerase
MPADDLLLDDRIQFDHLGVLVPELAHGQRVLSAALGIRCWTDEFDDPVNDVFVQFGRCPGGMCYETVAPRSERSPVRNALKRRINLFNHVAYRVAGFDGHAARLRAAGFSAVDEPRPAVAYGGQRIQFFANADGLLVELIDAPDHRHIWRS